MAMKWNSGDRSDVPLPSLGGRTSKPDKIDRLSRVPLFEGFRRRELKVIARHADIVDLPSKRVLARPGQLGLEFVVLLEGRAWVERRGQAVARLTAGDCFGEKACLDRKPRETRIVADTDVTVAVFPVSAFDYLLNAVPELSHRILLRLCRRLDEDEEAVPNMSA